MKCPKCSYVSHDYLDACRKCGVELVAFKKDIGLLVVQPGVLDLSLVLGEAGADDLFASMGEDITMHAGDDDDFEISLDHDAAPPEARQAHVEAPQAGARETAEGGAGLDHLTLELDVSALSMELAARQQTAPAVPDTPTEPPTPAVPAAAAPEESMPPGHMTIELGLASMTSALPPGMLEELAAMPPPSVPETAAPEDVLEAPDLEVSLDSAALAAFMAPAESAEMAEATPVGPEEQEPESIDPMVPVLELLDVDVAVENIEAERGAEPPEGGESVNTTLDSFEPTVDDAPLVSQANEPSGSDLAEVVEPDLSPVDTPSAEEVSLWPGFELSPDTSASADEPGLMDLAAPRLDDAALAFTAENMPPTQPSDELTATPDEATPEDTLTPSDISALEDLEEPTLPRHLTLDLSPPDTSPEQDWATSDALSLGDFDVTTLPGHLTLDLDVSQLMADWSSATLDDAQLDHPPDAGQSETSPPQHQAGDEEELLLDLDDAEFDDDTKA